MPASKRSFQDRRRDTNAAYYQRRKEKQQENRNRGPVLFDGERFE